MPALDRKTLKRYRADPAAFIEECLINPESNKPFVLLDAERAFLKHAFRLRANGRLLYDTLIYACPKKSGKTTFAALFKITIIVLYADRYGEAYACANDQEQAVSRVFEMCRRIIEASPLLKREAKINADRIVFPATGATIVALASDYASAAGSRPTCSMNFPTTSPNVAAAFGTSRCPCRWSRSAAAWSSLMRASRTNPNCCMNFISAG